MWHPSPSVKQGVRNKLDKLSEMCFRLLIKVNVMFPNNNKYNEKRKVCKVLCSSLTKVSTGGDKLTGDTTMS